MDHIREWKRMLVPYEQAVEELKGKFKSVRKEYRDLNDYSPIEFVTGRVKSISSILEKAKRRHIPEDQIEDLMEDIAGIRIMCQFTDDIYTVVDLLHRRDGKDLKIFFEKDYINNPKESGYKSYHVIIKYPVQTVHGEKEILAELQIRTLAMNFWATIEHSLNYKYSQNIPEEIKERLRTSAIAAASLDEEMCEIRNEVINAQIMFEQKSNITYDITESIKLLTINGQHADALSFQGRFDELWQHGSVEELEGLLDEIKNELPVYSLFRKKEAKTE